MVYLDGEELDRLWDFDDPAGSEQRFHTALATSKGNAADELRTQIARARGLQGEFSAAHTTLDAISNPDATVQQRIALERGRIHNSAGDVSVAIPYFQRAHDIGTDPFLTLDAIHMLAMTDVVRAEQWFHEGLDLAQKSTDPRVRRWEGSLRNNFAWHLADQENLADALAQFREAEAWFATHGTERQHHIARWSVAHVLRRLGERDEARTILLELKAQGEPDTYVDEELERLGDR